MNNMTSEQLREYIMELEDITQEIEMQARQAFDILQRIDPRMASQAQAYWLPSVVCNVATEHEWLGGGSMITLSEQIEELNEAYLEMTRYAEDDVASYEEMRDSELDEFMLEGIDELYEEE